MSFGDVSQIFIIHFSLKSEEKEGGSLEARSTIEIALKVTSRRCRKGRTGWCGTDGRRGIWPIWERVTLDDFRDLTPSVSKRERMKKTEQKKKTK